MYSYDLPAEMTMNPADPETDYQEWLRFVFDHPAREDGKAWYDHRTLSPEDSVRIADQARRWESDRCRLAKFMTRAFSSAGSTLTRFESQSVGIALWYLLEYATWFHLVLLTEAPPRATDDASVPWETRRDLIRSIYPLFSEYFANQTTLHPYTEGVFELWWEKFPLPQPFYDRHAPSPLPEESQLYYDETLGVMEKILALHIPRCRNSTYFHLDRWDEPTGKARALEKKYAPKG